MSSGTGWATLSTVISLIAIGYLLVHVHQSPLPTHLSLYIKRQAHADVRHANAHALDVDIHFDKRLAAAQTLPGGIPCLIHQTWKDEDVPDKFGQWPWSWKLHNPAWVYTLWTDANNRRLIEQHYEWFLETYDALQHPVMKSDAARLFYMHRYAG